MKRTTNQRAFSYGIAGVVIAAADSRDIIGQLQTTGNLNIAGLTSEVIETRGGFSAFPQAARRGISTGEFTLTINECPPWIKQVALGAVLEDIAPAAVPVVSEKRDIIGNSVPTNTISVTTPAEVQDGTVVVRATGAAEADVTVYYPDGEYVFSGIGAVDAVLTGTGLTLVAPIGMTAGDSALYKVRTAHRGGEVVRVMPRNSEMEYRLTASSVAIPGGDDSLMVYTLPRVKFFGLTPKLEDNVATSGVEITGKILTPKDGGAVFFSETLTI